MGRHRKNSGNAIFVLQSGHTIKVSKPNIIPFESNPHDCHTYHKNTNENIEAFTPINMLYVPDRANPKTVLPPTDQFPREPKQRE